MNKQYLNIIITFDKNYSYFSMLFLTYMQHERINGGGGKKNGQHLHVPTSILSNILIIYLKNKTFSFHKCNPIHVQQSTSLI